MSMPAELLRLQLFYSLPVPFALVVQRCWKHAGHAFPSRHYLIKLALVLVPQECVLTQTMVSLHRTRPFASRGAGRSKMQNRTLKDALLLAWICHHEKCSFYPWSPKSLFHASMKAMHHLTGRGLGTWNTTVSKAYTATHTNKIPLLLLCVKCRSRLGILSRGRVYGECVPCNMRTIIQKLATGILPIHAIPSLSTRFEWQCIY